MATLWRGYRTAARCGVHARSFSVSPSLWMPRQSDRNTSRTQDANEQDTGKGTARSPQRRGPRDIVTFEDLDPSEVEDASSLGHSVLQQQRQLLYYMRLIEHEMPQLAAYRKPFVPPAPSRPLVIRSVSFGGEEHPLTRKRTLVVPISRLPLKSDAAKHKFRLLAGPRWSPEPPKDSGISVDENTGQHGYVKISCEDFPEPAMNLKWASDTLDRMVAESNLGKDKFTDLPADTRHLESKARKEMKGGYARGRGGARPSIKDFPQEWLPTQPVEPRTSASTR